VPKPPQVLGRKVAPDEGEPERKPRESNINGASQESVQAKTRRQFTASEKLRLVKAAEVALASGERGALEALLRREGIYSSQLSAWRVQFGANGESGLTSRKPGRKPKLSAHDRALLAVTKENEALQRKLRIANALIALQKKAHELLGLTLPEPEEES
jgi:transposase-like protein